MGNTISGGARLPDKGDTSSYSQLHSGCAHTTASSHVGSTPSSRLNSSLTDNDGQSKKKAISKKKNNNNNNTDGQIPKGLLVMTLGVFLSGALAGKALSSSQRAKRAESSAKAWEKVCMALAGKNYPTQVKPSISHKRIRDGQQQSSSQQHIKDDRISWEELTGEPKIELPTSKSSSWNSTYQISKREAPIKASSIDTTTATGTLTDRSPYAAIHPHEDWDWTPADHPRPRKPWQKTRLPSCSLGFTSTPKVQAEIQAEKKPSPLKAANEAADESIEDHLIRAAIWPACDVGNASEAELIAEEVYKDMSQKDSSPNTSDIKKKEAKINTTSDEKLTEDAKKRITATMLVKEIRERRAREQEKALRLERERKAMMQEKARLVRSRSEAFWKRRVADSEEAKRVQQERLEQNKKTTAASRDPKEESDMHQILERHMWALMARAQNLEEKVRRYESRSFFR